jgi:hypothetical protein
LTDQNLEHSREVFRRWVEREYCAGECRATIELASSPGSRIRAPRGKPFGVHVLCTNTSVKPWHLRPGPNAGIHASWSLSDAEDRAVATGRSGLFDATVSPGEKLELTLALPALGSPGRYQLYVDMEDERHARFVQEGSEPLIVEVEVP